MNGPEPMRRDQRRGGRSPRRPCPSSPWRRRLVAGFITAYTGEASSSGSSASGVVGGDRQRAVAGLQARQRGRPCPPPGRRSPRSRPGGRRPAWRCPAGHRGQRGDDVGRRHRRAVREAGLGSMVKVQVVPTVGRRRWPVVGDGRARRAVVVRRVRTSTWWPAPAPPVWLPGSIEVRPSVSRFDRHHVGLVGGHHRGRVETVEADHGQAQGAAGVGDRRPCPLFEPLRAGRGGHQPAPPSAAASRRQGACSPVNASTPRLLVHQEGERRST